MKFRIGAQMKCTNKYKALKREIMWFLRKLSLAPILEKRNTYQLTGILNEK